MKPSSEVVGLRALALSFMAATLVVSTGCEADECRVHADCGQGGRCADGVCEAFRLPISSRPSDAGATPTPDAAVDAGSPEVPISGRALVWLGDQLESGSLRAVAEADFVDTAEAEVQSSRQVVDGKCVLAIDRIVSGAPTGFEAKQVDVRFDASPHNPTALTLLPTGVPGQFRTTARLTPPILGTGRAAFEVVPAAAAESLASYETSLPIPARLEVLSPLDGETVALVPPLDVLWHRTEGPSSADLIIEVSDRAREVVLTCRAEDAGRFVLTEAHLEALTAAGPTAPLMMAVRRQHAREVVVRTLDGRHLSVVFRVSRGQQNAIQ